MQTKGTAGGTETQKSGIELSPAQAYSREMTLGQKEQQAVTDYTTH